MTIMLIHLVPNAIRLCKWLKVSIIHYGNLPLYSRYNKDSFHYLGTALPLFNLRLVFTTKIGTRLRRIVLSGIVQQGSCTIVVTIMLYILLFNRSPELSLKTSSCSTG